MKNKISISQKEKSNIDKDLKNIFIKLIVSETNRISELEYNHFHKLIKDNIENVEIITYIIHSISKEILSLEKNEDKIKLLNLLNEFYSPLNIMNYTTDNFNSLFNSYSKYTSRILTVIQDNILLDISANKISDIFGRIIYSLFSNNIFEVKEIKIGKKTFEILQGFCFYNMKQSTYRYQIVGVLCFKELISTTDFYKHNKNLLKNLYEKIILFLDNTNFEPKMILFEVLSVFIKKSQKLFEPYINMTLYKILNYMEESDIKIKRKIIDAFIIIISEFPYEFQNISNSIINYLNLIIKNNDDSYIENKCKEALSFYNNFNFYSTFDNNFKTKEQNQNLFKNSRSSFYKTINKKSDTLTSKSTRHSTLRKYLKDNKDKYHYFYDSHKIWNRNNNNLFSYSSKYENWKKNSNFSKTFNINKIYSARTIDDNNNKFKFNFTSSSLNKIAKKFGKNNKLKNNFKK